MNGFALTTSIVADTPYWDAIWPLTEPLFRAYADRWEMDFEPHFMSPHDPDLHYFDTSPAPRGTGVVYAGIPHRRDLLDRYKGYVFLDSDAVIMDDSYDICREVDEDVPMAAAGDFNGAVQVYRSSHTAKIFHDEVWLSRHYWRTQQWLEQGCMMDMMGWDGRYPGDNQPAEWMGETEWTPYWTQLSGRWNAHWAHPQAVRPLIWHPGGMQPFSERLRCVRAAIAGDLSEWWPNWKNLEAI